MLTIVILLFPPQCCDVYMSNPVPITQWVLK